MGALNLGGFQLSQMKRALSLAIKEQLQGNKDVHKLYKSDRR
jgi:hypothetical protein